MKTGKNNVLSLGKFLCQNMCGRVTRNTICQFCQEELETKYNMEIEVDNAKITKHTPIKGYEK